MQKNPTKDEPAGHRTTLTARFREALGFAAILHADQVRKGSGIPYVAHLLAVAVTVIEEGGSDDLDRLKRYIERPTPEGWQSIKKRLVDAGSIEYSTRCAAEYISAARDILERFPESPFRTILFELSDFLLFRKY